MSNMTRPDETDELVSSVRNLVANDSTSQARKMPSLDRLVLTPAQRVEDAESAALPDRRPDTGQPVGATEADLADLTTLDGIADAPLPQVAPAPADDLETRITHALVAEDVGARIDDDALRQIVLQVLREELAGDMGERITRNVRKLVRREINRVLASRDLD